MKITHDDYKIFKSFKHLYVIKDVWNLPKDIGTDIINRISKFSDFKILAFGDTRIGQTTEHDIELRTGFIEVTKITRINYKGHILSINTYCNKEEEAPPTDDDIYEMEFETLCHEYFFYNTNPFIYYTNIQEFPEIPFNMSDSRILLLPFGNNNEFTLGVWGSHIYVISENVTNGQRIVNILHAPNTNLSLNFEVNIRKIDDYSFIIENFYSDFIKSIVRSSVVMVFK